MRIECESCGAAYAIDDALISDRGVRAQCPRCGHQKVVRKEADASAMDPFGAATAAPPAATQDAFGAEPAGAANKLDPFGSAAQVDGGADPFGATRPAAPRPEDLAAVAPGQDPFGATRPAAPRPQDLLAATPGGGAPADPFAGSPPAGPPADLFAGEDAPQVPPPDLFASEPASAEPFSAPPAVPGPVSGADPFAGSPPAAPSADPFAGSPPAAFASAPPAALDPSDPFGGSANVSAPQFGGAEPAPADPFGGPPAPPSADPFGGAPADPFAGTPPAAPGPPPPPTDPFSGTAPGDPFAPSGAAADPFAASAPAGADPFAGTAPDQSSAMGGAPDPFSGTPAAQTGGKAEPANAGPGAAPEQSAPENMWQVRLAEGKVLGPLSANDVKDQIRSGAIGPKAEVAQGSDEFSPILDKHLFQATLKAAASGKTSDRTQARGASVKQRSAAPLMIFAVVALAVAGAIGVAFFKPEWLPSFGASEDTNPLEKQKGLWSLQYPDVDGTSDEHLRKGRKHYLDDTSLGYRLADEELRKALLLDPDNIDAIASYVENLARLPGVANRVEDVKVALEGIEYALKLQPEKVALYRAKGALLLTLGDVQKAQSALFMAHRINAADAETLLFLAESNIRRNNKDALGFARRAQKADASLKRINLVLGKVHIEMGEFHQALKDLKRRLKEDAEHEEALVACAYLYSMIGSFGDAVKSLQRVIDVDGENLSARLQLAKVYYQALGDLRQADLQLTVAADTLEAEEGTPDEAREILTHLSYVRSRRGKWEEAEQLAQKALEVDSSFAPARFALGRALSHKGEHKEALKLFDRVAQATAGRYMETPALVAIADIHLQLGNRDKALEGFRKVIESDPRIPRGYLGLAAAHASRGGSVHMAARLRQLIDVDPDFVREHLFFSDFPEDAREYEVYLQQFKAFEPQADEDTIRHAAMGMVSYHMGDISQAEAYLQNAIKEDSKNHGALMYLGASLLKRKSYQKALEVMTRASDANELHNMTKYLLGKAQFRAGKFKKAAETLDQVSKNEPSFVPALCARGDLARRNKDRETAKALYKQAFVVDVDLMSAKRGLFLLGQ